MVLVILRGDCLFHHGNRSVRAGRGSVVLYRQGERQHYGTNDVFEVLGFLLHLGKAMRDALAHADRSVGCTWPGVLREHSIDDVVAALTNQTLPEPLAAHRNAVLVESLLCRCLAPAEEPVRLPRRTRFHDVAEYVRLNPESPHTVDELARMAGLSPSRFRFLFRNEFGQSAGAFVHQVRMERAAWLLRSTNVPAGEIGLRLGYNSPYAFYTAFRNAMGVTPTEYRRTETTGRL